jgi:hypothetical protein
VDEREQQSADTTRPVETARAEVAQTEPARAPLPDVEGLANSLSPVDLPEPDEPLAHPLRWTVTVIATACLVLALFNAGSVRGWSYELKETETSQRIVTVSESWFNLTAAIGLDKPAEQLRGLWEEAKAARFPGTGGGEEATPTEKGPATDAGAFFQTSAARAADQR